MIAWMRGKSSIRARRRRRRGSLDHGRTWPAPRTTYLKLVSCSGPTGPAGVEAAGGDADLGAEAELAAVGELGRGVPQHDRAVDIRRGSARPPPRPRRRSPRYGRSRSGRYGRSPRPCPATTRTARIGARYSVGPVRFVGGGHVGDGARSPRRRAIRSRPRASAAAMAGSRSERRARSISSVSVAPQTETRRSLALTTMSRAMSGSAEAWT